MKLKYKVRQSLFTLKALALGIMLTAIAACTKLANVAPPISSVNSQNVYQADATAIAALSGFYQNMQSAFDGRLTGSLTSTSYTPSLSADELVLYDLSYGDQAQAYTNTLNTMHPMDFWSPIYANLYVINAAIEGLNQSTSLTPSIKQQLLGEAEFDRAFCYFYLVNLYGDVPLALSSDYKANAVLPRAPTTLVYKQIAADLVDAQSKLSANFLDGTLLSTTGERVRPTKWAAMAMLARVDLYTGNYTDAIKQATFVINNSGQFSLGPLDNVFLTTSTEAIWQIEIPNTSSSDTPNAYRYIIPSTGINSDHPVSISTFLINAFENNDQRKTRWVDSVTLDGKKLYYPYKYKNNLSGSPVVVTEYDTPLRLAEQYLIRAEAEANNNDPADAITDLNVIRARAGLPGYAGASDMTSLLSAIFHERQVEFFSEWGNRWFDLRRSGTINSVMGVVTPKKASGQPWRVYQALYPVPLTQLQYDAFLKQNPGY